MNHWPATIAVASTALIATGFVSFAAGTSVVETVPVPGPTITATATVEVTRTPRATRDKPRTTVVKPTVTPQKRPQVVESRAPKASPLTGWKAAYWSKGQAWAQTAKVRAVISCESGDRVDAVSPTGKYRGLFQFDADAWASYGGLELAPTADRATRAEQNYVGFRLFTGRGWSPWTCA